MLRTRRPPGSASDGDGGGTVAAMKARANRFFPFAVAIVFPPAGVLLAGAGYLEDHDRDMAVRLVLCAFLGACLWGAIIALAGG